MFLGYQDGKVKFYVETVKNPEFYPDTTWVETQDEYILNDDMTEYIKKPENYEEILAQKERDRINALSLTSADIERALYKAKGIDFDDVVELAKQANEQQAQIQTVALADEIPEKIDIKALKIELKANNFYRGHPYINKIGALLGYTSDDLDYLFENKELPEKTLDNVIKATEEAGLYTLPAEALEADADSAEDLTSSAVIKKDLEKE